MLNIFLWVLLFSIANIYCEISEAEVDYFTNLIQETYENAYNYEIPKNAYEYQPKNNSYSTGDILT